MSLTQQRITELQTAFPQAAELIALNGNIAEFADFKLRVKAALNTTDDNLANYVEYLKTANTDINTLIELSGYTESNNGKTLAQFIADIISLNKDVIEKNETFANGYSEQALRDENIIYAPAIGFNGVLQNYTFASATLFIIEQRSYRLEKVESGGIVLQNNGVDLMYEGQAVRVKDTEMSRGGRRFCTVAGIPYRIDGISFEGLTRTQNMFLNTGNLFGGRIYDDIHDTLNDYTTYRNGIIIDNTVACNTNSMFLNGNGTEIMFADGFKGTSTVDFFGNSKIKSVKNFSFVENSLNVGSYSFCRYCSINHLTFAKGLKIKFAMCTQLGFNNFGGKGAAIPQNLDIESVKDYIKHLYNWNIDEDNLLNTYSFTNYSVTVGSSVYLIKTMLSNNEIQSLINDYDTNGGTNYIKMVVTKGWEPLSLSLAAAAAYEND